MKFSSMWRTISVLCALLAVAVARPRALHTGDEMQAGEVDVFGRLKNLRFLHVPKTGSSFITSMRNYLTYCPVKNFTCTGWVGGSDTAAVGALTSAEHHCYGYLFACGSHTTHLPWVTGVDGVRWNVVTMLREPTDLFKSGYRFDGQQRLKMHPPKTPLNPKEFLQMYDNTMTKMLSGMTFGISKSVNLNSRFRFPMMDARLHRAVRRLANETAFWGITAFWETSVCLFHKELNGPGSVPSEMLNTRKTPAKESLPELEDPEVLIMEKHRNMWDHALYGWALPRFLERVQRSGCPVPPELEEQVQQLRALPPCEDLSPECQDDAIRTLPGFKKCTPTLTRRCPSYPFGSARRNRQS